MVRFELPPPEPLRKRIASAWGALPGLVRAAIAILLLVTAPSYVLWSLAGDFLSGQLQRRAAFRISEDFRGGLEAWMGGPDWNKTWSRTPAGYVEVGRLALLKPTRLLADYECEFLGQITGRTMGWVYRAQDLENYYAAKLAIVKPGPLPGVALIRYTVVGGRQTGRVQIPVRVVVQPDRPVRVRLLVKGDGFTTWIAGDIVDFWQDGRFRSGGIGFFGEAPAHPQLYWVKVWHQNDVLGRLCKFLAPGSREDSR